MVFGSLYYDVTQGCQEWILLGNLGKSVTKQQQRVGGVHIPVIGARWALIDMIDIMHSTMVVQGPACRLVRASPKCSCQTKWRMSSGCSKVCYTNHFHRAFCDS